MSIKNSVCLYFFFPSAALTGLNYMSNLCLMYRIMRNSSGANSTQEHLFDLLHQAVNVIK